MRPRTKYQEWALGEMKNLPGLSERNFRWAVSHLMTYDGYTWTEGAYSKKRRVVWCQNCGKVEHIPYDEGKEFTCARCGSKLALIEPRKHPKRMCTEQMFVVPETHKGWQVFSCFGLLREISSVGAEPVWTWKRRFCVWVNDRGHEVITTVPYSRGYCAFKWREDEPWTIGRHNSSAIGYYAYDDMYDLAGVAFAPYGRWIPELVRRGWGKVSKMQDDRVSKSDLCRALLTSSVAETLAKTGHKDLLAQLVREGKGNRVEKYWPSVKIALRHGMKYRTKDDIGLWLDYLQGLEQEHRDMRSPKWLLPEDLNRAHRAQIERMRKASERKRRLAQLEEDRRFDEELRKRIGAVAGFVLTDGNIEISPLKTVNDFYCEGNALHHCVFAMEYYKRKDCLILGAKVNGERTETIEVSLKDFSVAQCRGKNNMDSPYHKRIMSLMSSNLGRLRDVYRRAH